MKRILSLSIFLSSTLFFASPEAGWTFRLYEVDGSKTYIDNSSIKTSGSLRRMWILTDMKQPDEFMGKKYRSARHYLEFNCAERQVRFLDTAFFSGAMATGKNISPPPTGEESPWLHVAPETSGEAYLEAACAQAK